MVDRLPWAEGPAARRILIVSDAWQPQVNGVVRTLDAVRHELVARGDQVTVIGPDRFRTFPMPGYREIPLALVSSARLRQLVDEAAPESVHVATEGPLGWAMRALCRRRGWRFTSSFHTRFPDYLHARAGIPRDWSWALLRRFHAPAAATLCTTPALAEELAARGFAGVQPWSRGVDLAAFAPGLGEAQPWESLPRPIFLAAGRVAVEKKLDAFLGLDLPGSKVVVGDGPARTALQKRFPAAHFAGWLGGASLARAYGAADVMVFPSRTDTFGLVVLEALACGTPVAAYPVPGPREVIAGHGVGAVAEDLRAACLAALGATPEACRARAAAFSWAACAARFRASLVGLA